MNLFLIEEYNKSKLLWHDKSETDNDDSSIGSEFSNTENST